MSFKLRWCVRNCRTRFVFLKSLKVFLVVLGMFGLKITFIKHDISRRFFMEIIKITEILKKIEDWKRTFYKACAKYIWICQ